MNINKLKAGDWVMFNLAPVKVVEIHNTLGELTVADISSIFDTPASEIEPLPLTIEILEKNEFTIGNYNEWSNPCCSFLHFVIDNLETNEWGVYARETMYEVHIATIRYVHELQHLLYALNVHCNIVTVSNGRKEDK